MGISLYPFQEEDIQKLAKQNAVLIGSEMGTGKTFEAIALDQIWFTENNPKQWPTLVIAPLNTFDSWEEKYSILAPDIDVCIIDRKNRGLFLDDVRKGRGDVFLMHWDALRLMPELQKIQFQTIIADEIHRAANRNAQATRALKKLNGVKKIGMSGTAPGDKPDQLWSIFNWLYPTYYKSYWKFRKHYMVEEKLEHGHGAYYSKIVGLQNVESLHAEIRPWYVRHLKKEPCCVHHPLGVMPWLKDKVYDKIYVELTSTQRKLYDDMRKNMIAWLGQHEETPLTASVVVAQLARLSQMAIATPTFDKDNKITLIEPSSKIAAAKEMVEDHPGKQFIIFSASVQAINLAKKIFERSGITCCALTGQTPQSERQGMISRFQEQEYQVFFGSIAAIGEGVDGLQMTCDTAIFLDRHWSSWRNQQAEDRLHRDGQKDTVQIIDIMARNTLDFGRHQKLEMKWSWIKMILGDPAAEQRKLNYIDIEEVA